MIEPGLLPEDVAPLIEIVRATGFFRAEEVAIARELMEQHLTRGAAHSGYYFERARDFEGGLAGFACYGPIPGTDGSFDLYWIAVHPRLQGRGLGRLLVDTVAAKTGGSEGRLLYAETSSQPLYDPTRSFYLRNGFHEIARLPGFYRAGDDKIVYARNLGQGASPAGGEGRER
ncbi:GCN5-related N-acetyltransferase [mine drainage metagenome]|uniref:GCN5-related N-acetyltransferase n=2 Tax=mine drainage metagenome TaxID=410659 RepID=T1A3K9_9ZZZZ